MIINRIKNKQFIILFVKYIISHFIDEAKMHQIAWAAKIFLPTNMTKRGLNNDIKICLRWRTYKWIQNELSDLHQIRADNLYSYITNTFDILFKKGGEGKIVDNKRFVSNGERNNYNVKNKIHTNPQKGIRGSKCKYTQI